MQQGVERVATEGGRQADEQGHGEQQGPRVPEHTDQRERGRRGEGHGQQGLLGEAPPQRRCDHVADEGPAAVRATWTAYTHGGSLLRRNVKAKVKTKKPTAMRMAMKPIEATTIVGRWVSAYSTSSGTIVERSFGLEPADRHGGRGEEHGADGQHPRGAEPAEHERADQRTDAAEHTAQAGQPGVRADEVVRIVGDQRDQGLLDHPGRLADHQQDDGEQVERQLVQRERQGDAGHGAQRVADEADDVRPAVEPVDRRSDQRGEHGQGGERDQQVQQDLLAGGVGAEAEEQRAGERDRHTGVARGRQAMGDRQRPLPPWPETQRRESRLARVIIAQDRREWPRARPTGP